MKIIARSLLRSVSMICLSLFSVLAMANVHAESATTTILPEPIFDDNMGIHIPCMGVNGQQFAVDLEYVPDSNPLEWKLSQIQSNDLYVWNNNVCASLNSNFNLTIPSLQVGENLFTFLLDFTAKASDPEGIYFTYDRLYGSKGNSHGFSDSHGTLSPYTAPQLNDGTGKTLLAVYVVGSDLESNYGAATTDFNEMIRGYASLSDPSKLDIVIAFGGAAKDGWAGMKFFDILKLIEDGEDGAYGNEPSGFYTYREDRAHMGDESSLTHFLNYIREGYGDHEKQIMVMWDHGSSYNGFGNDDNFNGDPLSLDEIDSAFTAAGTDLFDLIGFDACLMGAIEVAQKVQKHARYLLASEETEPGHGWNWEAVVKAVMENSSVKDAATAIVNNFVQDVHEYKDTGKTLSVVDLDRLSDLEDKVDAVSNAFTEILNSGAAADAVIAGITRSQEYGKQGRADERTSVDISHMARLAKSNTEDPDLMAKLDALIAAVDAYVIHTKNDGTKPNSYGVSMIAPENEIWEDGTPGLIDFQDAYQSFRLSDESAPSILEENSDADAYDLEFEPWNSEQWGEDATLEEWWAATFIDPFDIDSMTDDDWDAYYTWLDEGNGTSWYEDDEELWYFEEDELQRSKKESRARTHALLASDFPFNYTLHANLIATNAIDSTTKENRTSDATTEIENTQAGISAKFEDPNLTSVTTVFGNTMTFDGWGDGVEDHFLLSTATLEAYPTTTAGEYFTPQWNQVWYFMQFDETQEAAWLPLYFQTKFLHRGQVHSVFACEIDFQEAGKDYSGDTYPMDEDGNSVEYATLEVTINAQGAVVDYAVRPYTILYDGPEDEAGTVVYDKATRSIKPGDRVRLYALGINLSRKGLDIWNPESDFLTVAQSPKFTADFLLFEDEEGIYLPYDYLMMATDISGNYTMTEFSRAAMPDKLMLPPG